ncbi:phage transcriptional regulator, AlpA [Pseudogulbenkiania sp. NH8B]|uniref:helix-turn-helix transcriptional regulator n=1 Tax=Pseudogulbenkiania sp. (strain NH8B) TaxID=748280 RepID=UPI0002279FDD|nr:AlpA family phage regulatory protein [Pseudogulbenkiania sp. NH8B]BAK76751.1 phage transcriptional regulator, AlpA [Pseudogulbenkiania sp. NH8B]
MQLLTLKEVESKLGLKKTKIYLMIDKNEFPPPIKIGAASRWAENIVDEWIANRLKQPS